MPALEPCLPASTAVSPCPGCQHPLHLTSKLHGRLVRCRSCRSVLTVVTAIEIPHAEDDPEAPGSPPPATATPCPNCHSPLHFTPQLHGHFVQCRSCRSVLAVLWLAGHPESAPDAAGEAAAASAHRARAHTAQQAAGTATRTAVVEPCPRCGAGLHLVSPLLGCRIRCKSCRAVLDVDPRPWTLRLADVPAATGPQRPEAASGGEKIRFGWHSWWSRLKGVPAPPTEEAATPSTSEDDAKQMDGAAQPEASGEPAASEAAWNPSTPAGPSAPRVNGKGRSGAFSEPSLFAGPVSGQPAAAHTESVHPPEAPGGPTVHDETEAPHEPENLSEPEVLSDQEASSFLDELDASDEAQRRRSGPAELRLPPRLQIEGGSASGSPSADSRQPPGNGKTARLGHETTAAPKRRQPGRLTPDASVAAARILSPKSFAARLKPGLPSASSPPVGHAPPAESPPVKPQRPTPDTEPVAEAKVKSAPQPTPRRHAQPSLVESRGVGRRITAIVLLLATLAAAGSWWLFGSQGHPQSRYLPTRSELFLTMNWPSLTRSRFFQAAKDTPGLRLVERVRVFAQNAGLGHRDIERVTAGGTADGGNLIVVYRLTRPIPPEKIADRSNFKALRKTDGPSETVRGTPVYYVGPSALAFPEPQVIVNGDLELVREVLRARSAGIAGPLEGLLETADFSTTCLELSVGVPPPLRDSFLQACGEGAETVVATATNYTYGSIVKFRRTLQVGDPAAVEGLRTCAEQSIRKAAQDNRRDEKLRALLKEVHVSKSVQAVHIELEVLADALPSDCVKQLRELF